MAGIPFRQWHWNRLERGATIVVTLSTGANVRLMEASDFNAYRSGRQHRAIGGLVKQSPFRIVVPKTGPWYLTVDLAGLRANSVNVRVSVEPPPLPVARSAAPLSQIRHEPAPALVPDNDGRTWDVFISHASEDKAAVAEPLYNALTALGLDVWLDKAELRIGDSLRRRIDHGLSHSSFGVVILSHDFFAKGWPQYELDGLVSLSIAGQQRLLPIWHQISKDEIMQQSPSLVDKVARNTATDTIADIAAEIADVVREGANA